MRDGGGVNGPDMWPHEPLGRRDVDQREHGQGQGGGQDHLRQNEELVDQGVAADGHGDDGGGDGEQARDEAAVQGLDFPRHEAFHDHLAGEGAGERAVLPCRNNKYMGIMTCSCGG
jgi:hypothetical protein